MSRYFIYLQLGTLVFAWFARASADGRITRVEIESLLSELGAAWEAHSGKALEFEL